MKTFWTGVLAAIVALVVSGGVSIASMTVAIRVISGELDRVAQVLSVLKDADQPPGMARAADLAQLASRCLAERRLADANLAYEIAKRGIVQYETHSPETPVACVEVDKVVQAARAGARP